MATDAVHALEATFSTRSVVGVISVLQPFWVLLGCPARLRMRVGQEWKRVVERISARQRSRWAQRAKWTCSSFSIVANWRLMPKELSDSHTPGAGAGIAGRRAPRCSGV